MCVYVCAARVLVQICKTRAFQKLNPANFALHDEVIDAVLVRSNSIIKCAKLILISCMISLLDFSQTGTEEWFNIKKGLHQPMTKVKYSTLYTCFISFLLKISVTFMPVCYRICWRRSAPSLCWLRKCRRTFVSAKTSGTGCLSGNSENHAPLDWKEPP